MKPGADTQSLAALKFYLSLAAALLVLAAFAATVHLTA